MFSLESKKTTFCLSIFFLAEGRLPTTLSTRLGFRKGKNPENIGGKFASRGRRACSRRRGRGFYPPCRYCGIGISSFSASPSNPLLFIESINSSLRTLSEPHWSPRLSISICSSSFFSPSATGRKIHDLFVFYPVVHATVQTFGNTTHEARRGVG